MKKNQKLSLASTEEIKAVVSSANSIRDIIRYFGMSYASGSYRTIRKHLDCCGVSYSHIPAGLSNNKGVRCRTGPKAIALEFVMVENSSYSRGSLKNRLIKEGILVNQCYICLILPVWNSKPLILRLDHINGINNDNRKGNLRLVCPNCDSQLETFAGRNARGTIV